MWFSVEVTPPFAFLDKATSTACGVRDAILFPARHSPLCVHRAKTPQVTSLRERGPLLCCTFLSLLRILFEELLSLRSRIIIQLICVQPNSILYRLTIYMEPVFPRLPFSPLVFSSPLLPSLLPSPPPLPSLPSLSQVLCRAATLSSAVSRADGFRRLFPPHSHRQLCHPRLHLH